MNKFMGLLLCVISVKGSEFGVLAASLPHIRSLVHLLFLANWITAWVSAVFIKLMCGVYTMLTPQLSRLHFNSVLNMTHIRTPVPQI